MSYWFELYRQWRSFSPTIKRFYFSDAFFGLAIAVPGTLLNLHLLDVGYSADDIGTLQSVGSLVMAALAVPTGMVADRFGRRTLYVTGSILFAVPFLVIPFMTHLGALVAFSALSTVGNTLMFVTESPLLAGEVDADRRASVFTFMFINFFVWNTLGLQLAGWLPDWLPAGALSRYQWPLVLGAVAGIFSGIVRMTLRFQPHPPSGNGLRLRPSRTTLGLGAVSLLAGGAGALAQNFGNVILTQRFGMSSALIASLLTAGGILGLLGSMAVPWISRRTGDRPGYALAVGLQGPILILMGFSATAGLFVPGFLGRAVLSNMQMSLWLAFAMAITPQAERATANSYSMVGRNIGMAAASKLYGNTLAAGNYWLPHTVAGVLAVAAALATYNIFRQTKVD